MAFDGQLRDNGAGAFDGRFSTPLEASLTTTLADATCAGASIAFVAGSITATLADAVCAASATVATATASGAVTATLEDASTYRAVPRDGPSGWYVPRIAEHFAQLGINVPDFAWLCQETSGDLQPAIGATTLAPVGAATYQQTVASWSRKFTGSVSGTNIGFRRQNFAGIDRAAGESFACLMLVAEIALSSPGATQTIFRANVPATNGWDIVTASGQLRTVHASGVTSSGSGRDYRGGAHLFGWQRRGDTNQSGTFTELESLLGTHDESVWTNPDLRIGISGTTNAVCKYGFIVIWEGANAEFDMAAAIRKLTAVDDGARAAVPVAATLTTTLADAVTFVPSAPTDGPNDWYVPETAAHFAAVGLPTPDFLWLCQDVGTQLAPTIGSTTLVQVTNPPTYQQPVTGWARKFVACDGLLANEGWRKVGATEMALADGESLTAILLVADIGLASLTPTQLLLGWIQSGISGFAGNVGMQNTGVLVGTNAGVAAESTSGRDYHGNGAHLFGWQRRGDIDQSSVATELEEVLLTHSEVAWPAPEIRLGAALSTPNAKFGWVAIYKGTNAEFSLTEYLAKLRGGARATVLAIGGITATLADAVAVATSTAIAAGAVTTTLADATATATAVGPFRFEDYAATVELDGYDATVTLDDPAASVALDEYLATVAVDDHVATLELDDMSYTIKAGDLLPGISGRIRAPADVDLDGATLSMTFKGRTAAARTVAVVNDGLVAGQDEDADELEWAWHYDWQAGDTDLDDEYRLTIGALVGLLPMSFPNESWASFVIEPQL